MFHNEVSQALGAVLRRPRHRVSEERMPDLDDDLVDHLNSLERGDYRRDSEDGKDRRSTTSSWWRAWVSRRSEALKHVCGLVLHPRTTSSAPFPRWSADQCERSVRYVEHIVDSFALSSIGFRQS